MTTKKSFNYNETDTFQREFKKLNKRFKTLKEDLKVAKSSAIELLHSLNIDNRSIFELTGYKTTSFKLYKLKKFACKSLKGKGVNSGIRLIYAYYETISKVVFIEIYYKGDKGLEDRNRLKKYCNS
ncbi:MAG: hypothetical protein HRT90_07935 [Candidatus Margulisbacteria bacterium]|nr:hypothetical protein [Candidatus Margulisiibacteriota bacterium]